MPTPGGRSRLRAALLDEAARLSAEPRGRGPGATGGTMSQEHRVPAIDRAVAILDALGRYRDGLSLVGIARECRVTRSTGYRILNSLVAAGLVRRTRQSGTTRWGRDCSGWPGRREPACTPSIWSASPIRICSG